MSVEKKIGALEQHQYLGIWKKTSSPTDIRTVRTGITAYLCEHMKDGVNKEAARANNHPNHLKRGLDYLTKEDSGRLKVYGFLREDVLKLTGQIPHKMNNDDLVEACLQVWETRLKQKNIKRVAHKYMLSLPPDLCQVMAKTGHSADEVLQTSVRKTMRRYQEKYYPDQKIGYLVGIHHDRAHIHAHVMLFPTTGSGKLLRVTDEGKERGDRKPFQFMKEIANKAVSRFFERKIKGQSPASIRSPSRFTQSKLLALAVRTRMRKNVALRELSDQEKQLWQAQQYESLLSADEHQQRDALREGYEEQEKHFDMLMEVRIDDPQGLTDRVEANRMLREEQAEQLKKLLKQKKQLNEKMRQLRAGKQALFEDLGKWQRYRFPRGSISESGNDLRDPNIADWLVETMARSDEFGDMVREYVAKRQADDERIELPKQFLRAMAGANNPVAAEKFTEKDRFARQCIHYSGGKIVGPAFSMLDRYYRQDAALSKYSQKDFVKEFLLAAIETHRSELQSVREQKSEIQRKMAGLRVDQAASKIKEDVIDAAIRGRKPAFLEEYSFWQLTQKEIPIDGLTVIKRGRQNTYKPETEKKETL